MRDYEEYGTVGGKESQVGNDSMTVSIQSCFQYCEMITQIQYQLELAQLFVLHFHDGQVTLAGVNFTLTPETISQATGILNVGEEWNKRQ